MYAEYAQVIWCRLYYVVRDTIKDKQSTLTTSESSDSS